MLLINVSQNTGFDLNSFLTTLGTVAMAVLTFINIIISRRDVKSAFKSEKENLALIQRPYIFVINKIESHFTKEYGYLTLQLKNCGNTPALNIIHHINHGIYDVKPDDFNFTDKDLSQHHTIHNLAQNQEMSNVITITSEDAEKLQSGKIILVWGWCEYNDIFNSTIRHRTEFYLSIKLSFSKVDDKCTTKYELYFTKFDNNCQNKIMTDKDGVFIN